MPAPLRICITGSESTGKSTLAGRLARVFSASLSKEASRVYAEQKVRPLSVEDVELIVQRQISAEDEAVAEAVRDNASVVIMDTDLLSTKVYAFQYYKYRTKALDAMVVKRHADLYLLCEPDVAWVADGVRDRNASRAEFHAAFVKALGDMNARVEHIAGSWNERWSTARTAVSTLMSEHQMGVD